MSVFLEDGLGTDNESIRNFLFEGHETKNKYRELLEMIAKQDIFFKCGLCK
jgi:hypothetical protein